MKKSKGKYYSWDNDKGIIRDNKQMLQLVSMGKPVFRKYCGHILVAALNMGEKLSCNEVRDESENSAGIPKAHKSDTR